jgi:hypothetical protein
VLSLIATSHPSGNAADMLREINGLIKDAERQYEKAPASVAEGLSKHEALKWGLAINISQKYPDIVNELFDWIGLFSKLGLFDSRNIELTPVGQGILKCLAQKEPENSPLPAADKAAGNAGK